MWPFGKSTGNRVEDALNEQPRLQDLGLQVQDNRGEISISGMVPNQAHADLAVAIAQGVNGVQSVDMSGLIIEEDASEDVDVDEIAQEIEDHSRIAKEVHQSIRENGELADDPIDVLQSGNDIILRGVVDNDHELRLAEQLARDVEGVADVDVSDLRVHSGAKELASEKDDDGETVYTVQEGDSLSAIAEKYYGDPMEYEKLAQYNQIDDPDLIHPGQQIRIPG